MSIDPYSLHVPVIHMSLAGSGSHAATRNMHIECTVGARVRQLPRDETTGQNSATDGDGPRKSVSFVK